jgi:hypothetical protein
MPASDRLLALVPHIDLTRRILTNEYNGQAGCQTMPLFEIRDMLRDASPDRGREGFAVDDGGAHGWLRQIDDQERADRP